MGERDFYDEALAQQKATPFRVSADDVKWLMSSPRGRRIVRMLLDASGVELQSFVLGSPEGTAFNEGKRSMGLSLLHDVRGLCPEWELAMNVERSQQQ